MATQLSQLSIDIQANTKGLQEGLKKSQQQLNKFGKQTRSTTAAIQNLGKGLVKGAAITSGLILLGKVTQTATQSITELRTELGHLGGLSKGTGASVKGLYTLRSALHQAGLEAGQTLDILNRLAAAPGKVRAKDLSMGDLLTPAEISQMGNIGDPVALMRWIQGLGDPHKAGTILDAIGLDEGAKVKLEDKLFSGEWNEIINQTEKSLQKFNHVLTTKTTNAIEKLNKQIIREAEVRKLSIAGLGYGTEQIDAYSNMMRKLNSVWEGTVTALIHGGRALVWLTENFVRRVSTGVSLTVKRIANDISGVSNFLWGEIKKYQGFWDGTFNHVTRKHNPYWQADKRRVGGIGGYMQSPIGLSPRVYGLPLFQSGKGRDASIGEYDPTGMGKRIVGRNPIAEADKANRTLFDNFYNEGVYGAELGKNTFETMGRKFGEAVKEFGDTIGNSLTEAGWDLLQGVESWKDIMKRMGQEILRGLYDSIAGNAFKKLGGSLAGGLASLVGVGDIGFQLAGGGGDTSISLGQGIGSVLSVGRRHGGLMYAGRGYKVGEMGPEFVMTSAATRRYEPILEAMNKGRAIGGGGSNYYITMTPGTDPAEARAQAEQIMKAVDDRNRRMKGRPFRFDEV